MLTMPGRLRVRIAALATLGALACGVPTWAQSLGDVAKREEQRRKKVKASGKVYTNQDLGPGGTLPNAPAPTPAPSDAATPPATPSAQPAPAPEEPDPKTTEAYWRQRMDAARSELQRNELFLDALQSRVNALATDFVNRDDPAQRAVIANDRQKALSEMERVKDTIAKLKQQIGAIEDEARQAGVPPGWIR